MSFLERKNLLNLYYGIIKLFLEKPMYEAYREQVDTIYLKNNFPEILKIFNTLGELHKVDIQHTPSISDLEICFYTSYPKEQQRAVYDPLFKHISETDADKVFVENYLKALDQKAKASSLAFKLLEFAEDKVSPQQCEALVKAYASSLEETKEDETKESEFVSDDIEVLNSGFILGDGLNWRLDSLNRNVGPIRKGDLCVIYARPETGKTTFLASEVTCMAGQIVDEAPILWFNNEEQGEKVLLRCYEAALGAPLERIIGNMERARDEFYKRTKRRIYLRDDANIDYKTVERLCRKYKPRLIIIDQLDKVKGFAADREDLLLGEIYKWARELAKEFAPFIGVCQSGGNGDGIKYLGMNHMANAKTAKQAEADLLLGIGYSYQDPENVRGLSICKNKLLGGKDTVASMRHGKWDVLIRPDIARYEDMKR